MSFVLVIVMQVGWGTTAVTVPGYSTEAECVRVALAAEQHRREVVHAFCVPVS